VISYSVVCSFNTNKQQNKQPQLFLKMLDGFQKKKKYPSCACCLWISWDQPTMKMLIVFKKPTEQKCPKVLT